MNSDVVVKKELVTVNVASLPKNHDKAKAELEEILKESSSESIILFNPGSNPGEVYGMIKDSLATYALIRTFKLPHSVMLTPQLYRSMRRQFSGDIGIEGSYIKGFRLVA